MESGPFELYTDIDSKIKRLSKVKNLWFTFVWIEFIIAAANLAMTIYAWIVLRQMEWLNIGCVVFLVVMGLLLLRLTLKPARKIKSLKRKKADLRVIGKNLREIQRAFQFSRKNLNSFGTRIS